MNEMQRPKGVTNKKSTVTNHDIFDYVSDMSGQLAGLIEKSEQPHFAYLLRLAQREISDAKMKTKKSL